MEIIELSKALGSEARDVDITIPLSSADANSLRDAYHRTHAVLVRGQELTQDQMERFCGTFWPVHRRRDGTPHWTLVTNRGEQAARTGSGVLLFHSDHTFAERPNHGQALYAHEVSQDVAPTTFASMVRAVVQLPEDLRQRLASMRAVHIIDFECANGEATYRVHEPSLSDTANPLRYPRWSHPVLSPVDGGSAPALFVSESYASHIEGVSAAESEDILQQCFAVLYAADNVYEHHWQPHDIIVWNNLALQHGRPKPVVDGTREFWRLKSFALAGTNPEEMNGRSALDLYTDYVSSKT